MKPTTRPLYERCVKRDLCPYTSRQIAERRFYCLIIYARGVLSTSTTIGVVLVLLVLVEEVRCCWRILRLSTACIRRCCDHGHTSTRLPLRPPPAAIVAAVAAVVAASYSIGLCLLRLMRSHAGARNTPLLLGAHHYAAAPNGCGALPSLGSTRRRRLGSLASCAFTAIRSN